MSKRKRKIGLSFSLILSLVPFHRLSGWFIYSFFIPLWLLFNPFTASMPVWTKQQGFVEFTVFYRNWLSLVGDYNFLINLTTVSACGVLGNISFTLVWTTSYPLSISTFKSLTKVLGLQETYIISGALNLIT